MADSISIYDLDMLKLEGQDLTEKQFANIPIQYRDSYVVEDFLKSRPCRVRYRGKSIPGVYERDPSYCLKEYATSFTVYDR
tara:strand:- start:16252 stop:16494 length:243 start_codon:yes stop_codon:yes gene_type:complete